MSVLIFAKTPETNYMAGGNMKALSYLKLAAAILVAMLLTACGEVKVTPMPSIQLPPVIKKSESVFCTAEPGSQSTETRILFVVDKSGSNVSQKTDPTGTRRYGAINNFFNKYADNNKIKWAMIEFQKESANSLFLNPFFREAAQFGSVIASSQAKTDEGYTPYRAAITEIGNAIRDELLNSDNTIKYNFEIIFLSDGVPTDYGDQFIDDGKIMEDVQNLIEISVGFVHFSTVYYNLSSTADEEAARRLENMAQVGQGRFQDASNGEDLDFDELIKFGTEIYAYQVKDFFVYNLNTTLCDDGYIGADSDSDGLCDSDEDRYNSFLSSKINLLYAGKKFSKTNRNSFSTQFSDVFVYRQLMGESLPTCSQDESILDEDMDLLNNCEEKFLTNYSPMGPNETWTEEMSATSKHSSQTNFDSDGDGILDVLELNFFKERGLALDYFSIYKNFYGLSQYDLFKDHQSKINPTSTEPYQIDVKHVERKLNGQNCYSFYQDKLPLYSVQAVSYSGTNNLNLTHGSDENLVLVYYIITPENNPTSKGILMQSYQRIKLGSGPESIDVSAGRFTSVVGK